MLHSARIIQLWRGQSKQQMQEWGGGMQEREVVQAVIEGRVQVDTPDIPDVQFIKVVSTSI